MKRKKCASHNPTATVYGMRTRPAMMLIEADDVEIVDYRGMKMTAAQKAEYVQMERDQI